MSINLLPWREMQDQRRTKILLYFLCAYSMSICIAMTALKNFFSHETHAINTKTVLINDTMQKILLDYPKQHAALLQKLKMLSAKKSVSLTTNNRMMDLLSYIANDMPASITLNSLNINHRKIILTGVGDQLADIHQYYASLQQNLPWKHVLLTEIHNDSQHKSQMDFTIQVTP